jgi:hypothetical protein
VTSPTVPRPPRADSADPQRLLEVARGLLASPAPSLRTSWPRACAALTRLALELGLARYWQQRAPSLVGRPMRHQLLALPVLADAKTAALAGSAWHGLSRAMHHHTYELPPTAAELQGWLDETAMLLEQLDHIASGVPHDNQHRAR